MLHMLVSEHRTYLRPPEGRLGKRRVHTYPTIASSTPLHCEMLGILVCRNSQQGGSLARAVNRRSCKLVGAQLPAISCFSCRSWSASADPSELIYLAIASFACAAAVSSVTLLRFQYPVVKCISVINFKTCFGQPGLGSAYAVSGNASKNRHTCTV